MDPEVKNFVDNVDSWIKEIRREFGKFESVPGIVNENVDNIQHNYELIYELKDELDDLKQDVAEIKLVVNQMKKLMEAKNE